ncbi:TPA: hypothetical protein ACFNMU_000322 [Neisseria lactamica]
MPSERLQTAFVFQEAKEWGGQFIYIKTFGAVPDNQIKFPLTNCFKIEILDLFHCC